MVGKAAAFSPPAPAADHAAAPPLHPRAPSRTGLAPGASVHAVRKDRLRKGLVIGSILLVVVAASADAADAIPNWFGSWAQWRLAGATAPRPASAPRNIPTWAWQQLGIANARNRRPPRTSTTPTTTVTTTTPSAPQTSTQTTTQTTTPSTTTTSTPPTTSGGSLDSTEQALANAVNSARAANGLPALQIDGNLENAARSHTQDLLDNNTFTHDFIKNGTSYPFATWIWWYYSGACAGENLAWGSPTLGTDQAVQMWLASPEHRANMLSGSFTKMGVALITQNGTAIATTDFGC